MNQTSAWDWPWLSFLLLFRYFVIFLLHSPVVSVKVMVDPAEPRTPGKYRGACESTLRKALRNMSDQQFSEWPWACLAALWAGSPETSGWNIHRHTVIHHEYADYCWPVQAGSTEFVGFWCQCLNVSMSSIAKITTSIPMFIWYAPLRKCFVWLWSWQQLACWTPIILFLVPPMSNKCEGNLVQSEAGLCLLREQTLY